MSFCRASFCATVISSSDSISTILSSCLETVLAALLELGVCCRVLDCLFGVLAEPELTGVDADLGLIYLLSTLFIKFAGLECLVTVSVCPESALGLIGVLLIEPSRLFPGSHMDSWFDSLLNTVFFHDQVPAPLINSFFVL